MNRLTTCIAVQAVAMSLSMNSINWSLAKLPQAMKAQHTVYNKNFKIKNVDIYGAFYINMDTCYKCIMDKNEDKNISDFKYHDFSAYKTDC